MKKASKPGAKFMKMKTAMKKVEGSKADKAMDKKLAKKLVKKAVKKVAKKVAKK